MGSMQRAVPSLAVAVVATLVLFKPFSPMGAQDTRGEKAILDARPPSGARKAWEYRQTWPCGAKEHSAGDHGGAMLTELNELGKQGWELVSFESLSPQARDCFVATFKREVPR